MAMNSEEFEIVHTDFYFHLDNLISVKSVGLAA